MITQNTISAPCEVAQKPKGQPKKSKSSDRPNKHTPTVSTSHIPNSARDSRSVWRQ